MIYVRQLPSISELIEKYSLSNELKHKRLNRIADIKKILSGADNRKILCIGPCSADREDAVLDYVRKLSSLNDQVEEEILIVPRVYTGKPRTKGVGYKGILHRPDSTADHDDLLAGIIAARNMHLHVIQETGFFCIDEMLYPESVEYFIDLLAYVAVGARSVEDQLHRLTASGLEIPVGMKNPMSGDFNVLLNSIEAAQHEQSLIYRGWEVRTNGNKFAHAILRGYADGNGHSHPNYHYEDLCILHDLYKKRNIPNMSVIVDCNHSNSNKHPDEQIRIVEELLVLCNTNKEINSFVKGFMIESYLKDGSQLIGGHEYGKSITDACIGWDKTEYLIKTIAERLSKKSKKT